MTTTQRHSSDLKDRLRGLGLRPTRQRVAIARLLLAGEHRHVSADDLLVEARQAGIPVAQTTIYNILRQFAEVGLVREVVVEPGRAWFDTKIGPHIHIYDEDTGRINDLDCDPMALGVLETLELPEHLEVNDLSIVVRVKSKAKISQ